MSDLEDNKYYCFLQSLFHWTNMKLRIFLFGCKTNLFCLLLCFCSHKIIWAATAFVTKLGGSIVGRGGWFCHLFLKIKIKSPAGWHHEVDGDFCCSWILLTILFCEIRSCVLTTVKCWSIPSINILIGAWPTSQLTLGWHSIDTW